MSSILYKTETGVGQRKSASRQEAVPGIASVRLMTVWLLYGPVRAESVTDSPEFTSGVIYTRSSHQSARFSQTIKESAHPFSVYKSVLSLTVHISSAPTITISATQLSSALDVCQHAHQLGVPTSGSLST